jgi:hypothetical protein
MMMPTTFLVLYRNAIIWWATALIAPFEPLYDLIDDELERRVVR